jgi:NADPH-dependent curcumin reductase CurA
LEDGSVLVARAIVEVRAMSSDFRPGDIVRHKSGGQDIIIIRLENESVAGTTKKLAFCGRIEGQNFHKETIPVEMLVFVNRQFGT